MFHFLVLTTFEDALRHSQKNPSGDVVNWLFNVTINYILVIYVTAHICAGGLEKLYLRSDSQRH